MPLWSDFSTFLSGKRVFFLYTHRNGDDRFANGLKANTEISYWCFNALKEAFPRVTFLRFEGEKEWRIDRIGPRDVVIGHVGETFQKASRRTKKLIAFYPWSGHEDRSTNTLFNCFPFEQEKVFWEMARTLILLTSEYNVATYMAKATNFWFDLCQKKNLRVVHQPIDLQLFKRIKEDYSTSDFLYIGNDAHMKCLPDSKRLVEAVGRKLHLYGVEGRKISHLDHGQVSRLPSEADFFIQPGMWEGQCVSILESAARGFIPLVSPETGYPYSHPFLLRYNDFEYNLKVLREALRLSPQEKKELADDLHMRLVRDENHNHWKKLTDVLVKEVETLLTS